MKNLKTIFAKLLFVGLLFIGTASTVLHAEVKMAMLVKALGIGFFEAARDGGEEAAAELGDVELIYTAPTAATAEGQVEIINSLIAQKVDVIMISANDNTALVQATKRAMRRGIKVLSFDSPVVADGRMLNLNPSGPQLIGRKQVEMLSDTIKNRGQFAILSATSQAANQNLWIEHMKDELKKSKYKRMDLVDTVYGDDQFDKSYREALGLFKTYPNLRGIIAPTSVGIVAAAKAVEDEGLVGKVYVTGLGLPSEMKGHVLSGAVETFAIWNPIDLGYSSVYLGYYLATKNVKKQVSANTSIDAGRMGTIKVGENGDAVMSDPFIFDKSNVEKFAEIF